MSEQSQPFVEMKMEVGSKNREATEAELADAEQFKAKLVAAREAARVAVEAVATLERSCQHTVSIDTRGFPYDSRHCYACGKHQGMI